MPLTMAVHDVDSAVRNKVAAVAEEVGFTSGQLRQPVGELSASLKLRVRLGRALAPNPRILLSEHPNASLDSGDVGQFAVAYARLVRRRAITSLVLTADTAFAAAASQRILTLQPATGELKALPAWRRVFKF